jgi:hypothetical protein
MQLLVVLRTATCHTPRAAENLCKLALAAAALQPVCSLIQRPEVMCDNGFRLHLRICTKLLMLVPLTIVCVCCVLQILEVMCDDGIALCLSPQGFSNVNPATDIYNNANQ